MKAIPCLLILSIATVSTACAAESPITAPEIARHLGISEFRIPADKLPKRYMAALMKVEEGKIKGAIGGGTGGFSGSRDLVICGHPEGDRMVVTIDDGMILTRKEGEFGHSTRIAAPLAIELGGGKYLLWADYKRSPEGVMNATGKIEDVASGAILKIQAAP